MAFTTIKDSTGEVHNVKTRLAARRTSSCRCCKKPIEVGEDIVQLPKSGSERNHRRRFDWVHKDCAMKQAESSVYKRERGELRDITSTPAELQAAAAAAEQPASSTEGTLQASGVEPTEERQAVAEERQAVAEERQAVAEERQAVAEERQAANPFEQAVEAIQQAGKASQQVQEQLDDMQKQIEQLQETGAMKVTQEHIFKAPSGEEVRTDELLHPSVSELIELAVMREEVFLVGPTGSGKTYACEQAANMLFGEHAEKYGFTQREEDQRFHFVSCTAGMSEGPLTGRLLPVGDEGRFEYVIGEFVKAYESGGLFLLDEGDAADPNVLLVINAALANGKCSVPNRPASPYAKRHDDFIMVLAANTWGRGGDRQYVGRSPLDESTLDRFRLGTIEFNYHTELEEQLCPDASMNSLLNRVRSIIEDNRLERVVSTRFFKKADKALRHGWSHARVIDKLLNGWRKDEAEKIRRDEQFNSLLQETV